MMRAFNPKYPESVAFQGQPWLQNEFKASLNNLVRYCLNFFLIKKRNGHVEEMQLSGMNLPNTCKALGPTPSVEKKRR